MTDQSKELGMLADEYWESRLQTNPVGATALGDRRFDSKLPDITESGIQVVRDKLASLLAQCEALDESAMSEGDALTRGALSVELKNELALLDCHLEDWTVDPLGGFQVHFQNIESFQPVRTSKEGEDLVERWSAVGRYADEHIRNLTRGAGQGKYASAPGVEKVVQQVEELLSKPQQGWSFLHPLSVPHEGWSMDELSDFRTNLSSAVATHVRPAYAKYLAFLKSEIQPRARPQSIPGIMHVKGGKQSYLKLIKYHTSLDLSPEEIHQTGKAEVAKINAEMEALGERVFGERDRAKTLQRLRTDPSLYFSNRDEVAEKAERALRKAADAIPKWFGKLPIAECGVTRMEAHEEKHSTIAYYMPPAVDGSRPGRYYINTSEPQTRPRYEAEVLAYHESIPGHHLQIAIAQELENIPMFRKHLGVTAFIEGWGLYTERLSDEMGLYSSDLDRIGVLSYDSWRACRLVVDTGMHALGWTREQAIDFMLANSALARNNIVNEVDRYITWPGQALAYKIGQLEIMRLRKELESKLGKAFDIRKFHDRLLKNGAISIQQLRKIMQAM